MELPVINLVATGHNINQRRLAAGLEVKDIQEACGFSTPNAVYKWIRGQSLPTIDNMVILASILDTSIDDILVVERRKEEHVRFYL